MKHEHEETELGKVVKSKMKKAMGKMPMPEQEQTHMESPKKVSKVMGEYKRGTLHSGSGKKVTSHKQAIAIAMSEARKK